MAEQKTFSESWYRIAGQRICLRPDIIVRRQYYRGERWMVLENPFSNQFFRLRPAAYEFVSRLRPDRTVEEVWKECLDRFPEAAPGQETVLQLLSQLYFANLLQYDRATDYSQLFERYKKRRQREMTARLMNLMFMRFPLLDPDAFLVRTLPFVGKLISPFGAILWLAVVGAAIKLVVDNFGALREQSQAVLDPNNLLLFYAGLVLIKTLHEFGHAYFCRKFGGEVHVMGILLMIFTPVPYMDATSSWAFRSRAKRLLVGGAGMIVEIFFAALMTFVWANTGPGTLHNLAYNMMFIASISTIIFNINPLLRFDGYYLLSDLLEIPNLSQRSGQHLKHLAERYLFGLKKSESPTQSLKEKFWLVFYGITSGIYRIIVFGGILLVVADRFLLLGIIMAVICAISWVTVPIGKFIHYLASSERLARNRLRAVTVSVALVAIIIALLAVVPFPSHFRAPGLVQAQQRTEVVNEVTGRFDRLLAAPGSRVKKDQPLIQLVSPELELGLAQAQSSHDEIQNRLLLAMSHDAADLQPLTRRLAAVNDRLAKLRRDRDLLTIRARHDGIWVAPGIQDYVGRLTVCGAHLGLLLDPTSFEFTATVKQVDVDALFARHLPGAEVRLFGQAGAVVPIRDWKVIPAEHEYLPSPALGWRAGGEMPVSPTDPQGRKAAEPFFEVRADVPSDASAALLQGRSGKIRFNLQPEPLLQRAIRRLQQMLQKRYQI